ncbi:hypothetical protein JSE7799_00547 [Jannaschia seosinensis]|uniref:Uncharacterized protein n=1 Tax=Jannaschia seosinensis TaxID=313367 RepID=A0A0M7B713_9RHOB|nr:hypothetical protein JSE7799_00547 [Jannaschia seosinensis]
MVERFNGRIEEVLQSHHFRSGEDLETTLHRYVWLYNQQLPQSALASKAPLQAMKDWHKIKPELFKKQPYYLPGCDTHPLSGHRCAIPCRVTDKAYDHRRCRKECRARSIIPRIARRGLETSTKLGRHQWVVERTFAWFAQFVRRASPSQPPTTAAPTSTWPSPSSQPPS